MRPLRLRREQTCQGPLVLIDRAHPLQEGAPPELVPVDRLHPQVLLERRAARLLAACIRSVGGGRTIVPVSGWRSRAEQQAIWDDTRAREGDAFTRQYVALPGCSEHQTGLAIDLGEDVPDLDFIRPSFPGPAALSDGQRPGTASSSGTAGRRRPSLASPLSPGTSAMWGRPTPS